MRGHRALEARGRRGRVGDRGERLQADGESELAEAESARRWHLERGRPQQPRQTPVGTGQDGGEQVLVVVAAVGQEREAERVEQQPADPERVAGHPVAALGQSTQERRLVVEVGPPAPPAEPPDRHVAVERVVWAGARDQRARQVDAHLPREADRRTCRRPPQETRQDGGHELLRLLLEARLVEDGGCPRQRVHPLGEVVPVLPVAVPLAALVMGLVDTALRQGLADAQAPDGGVLRALLLGQAAQPARAGIVRPVPPEHPVHVGDQVLRHHAPARLSRRAPQGECVDQREGVGPEVALLVRGIIAEPGALGERRQQLGRPLGVVPRHLLRPRRGRCRARPPDGGPARAA